MNNIGLINELCSYGGRLPPDVRQSKSTRLNIHFKGKLGQLLRSLCLRLVHFSESKYQRWRNPFKVELWLRIVLINLNPPPCFDRLIVCRARWGREWEVKSRHKVRRCTSSCHLIGLRLWLIDDSSAVIAGKALMSLFTESFLFHRFPQSFPGCASFRK